MLGAHSVEFGRREEQHGQVIQSLHVIFAPSAHIANPGGEIGNGNHLVTQPGEISDVGFSHLPDIAIAARDHAERIIVAFQ